MKYFISIATFVLFSSFVFGQELTFTVSVSATSVKPGGRLNLTLQISGQSAGAQYEMPTGLQNDFNIVGGPFSSSQTTIINGKRSMEVSKTYTLTPKRTGTLTINAAKLTDSDGKVYTSKPIEIQVSDNPAPSSNKQFIAKFKFSKKTVYEGEQVIAIYDVYNRYNDLIFVEEDIPSPNGFVVEEIDVGQNPYASPKSSIQNGIRYDLYHLKKEILTPQQSGTMEIEGYRLEGHVNNSRGWGGRVRQYGPKKTFRSNSVTLHVKPLPKNAPSSFEGAVGQFDMRAEITETKVSAHQSVTLTITIKGKGNLGLIPTPTLNFPPSFETYDPKISNNIKVSESGISGSREFEYLIIPRTPGEYKIDAFNFSYFDPSAEKYKTLTSAPFEFSIGKGEGDDANATYTPAQQDDIQVLASDIRHIKTDDGNLQKKGTHTFASIGHLAGMLIPPTLFFFLFMFRKRLKPEHDEVSKRKKRASKAASKHLAKAKVALASNDSSFYDDVFKALYGYLGDKLHIQAAELSKVNIGRVLKDHGADDILIEQFQALLNDCELAKFTPSTDISKQEAFDKAGQMIQKMEDVLR